MRDEPSGEATVYDAYVELRADGSALAHVLDLPGCSMGGARETEALAAVAARIPAYYDWLRRHDDYTPAVRGPFRVIAREVVQVGAAGQRGGAFFTPDAEAVTSEDLDWYLSLLDWAYMDFAAEAHAQGHERFSRGGDSSDALMQRLAQEQLWLVSRLEARPTVPHLEWLAGSPRDTFHQVWQASLARLRATAEDERTRLQDHDGEQWSLRKVLRRSILLVVWAGNPFIRDPQYAE